MPDSVRVRTATGGILSLEITPADVISHCGRCRRTWREGDWYCDHLAVCYGHPIARLADRYQSTESAAAETRMDTATRDRLAAVFLCPCAKPMLLATACRAASPTQLELYS